MAKGTEKKGLGAREKQIIYILLGLIIVALAYFLGFTKFKESRDALLVANDKLQKEVNELQDMEANSAQKKKETEDLKDKVTKLYQDYPVELRTQNLIDYFDKLEKQIKNLDITTESFIQNMIYFQNGAVLESEVDSSALPEAVSAEDEAATDTETAVEKEIALDENGLPAEVTGYHSSVAVAFDTNYDNLKKIITFVNSYPKRTTINNINISAPEGNKDMSCTMTVNFYSVDGINGTYDDLLFPEVQIGKSNIFK